MYESILKIIQKFFCTIVIFQLSIGLTFVEAKQNAPPRMTRSEAILGLFNKMNERMALENPIWEYAINNDNPFPKVQINPDDPIVDRDPFFMRSQSWTAANAQKTQKPLEAIFRDLAAGYSFRKSFEKIEIKLPVSGQVLTINQPLTPLQATDDYLFFTADSDTFFQNKADDSSNVGQGLFFINTEELNNVAKSGLPVQMYFFPLPGNGWTGQLKSLEFHDINSLTVLSSSDVSLPIDLEDIRQVMLMERINGIMASLVRAIKADDQSADFRPAVGSTAGFGIQFTGLDLESPSQSFWPYEGSYGALQNKLQFLRKFFEQAIPSAKAAELDAATVDRLTRIMVAMGSIFIVSLISKYTVLKNKVLQIRNQKDRYQRPQPPQALGDMAAWENWGRQLVEYYRKQGSIPSVLRREGVETSNTFAHAMTVLFQAPGSLFKIISGLVFDGLAPAETAGEHKMLKKKIIEPFFLRGGSMLKNLPVSGFLFFLGFGVFSTYDTAFVYWGDFALLPWILTYLHFLPKDMLSLLDNYISPPAHPFDRGVFKDTPQAVEARDTLVDGVARNWGSGALNGAASFAADVRSQVDPQVREEVDKELKSRGKNPLDPNLQAYRNAEILKRSNESLRRKGFPLSYEFQFDFFTIYQKILDANGFTGNQSIKDKESLILQEKPALKRHALRRAISALEKLARSSSDPDLLAAIQLLKDTQSDMSVFNIFTNTRNAFDRYRQANARLTLLSYEGDLSLIAKHLPQEWLNSSNTRAANLAGVFFRKGLFSYLTEDEKELFDLKPETAAEFLHRAEKEVAELMRTELPSEMQTLPADEFIPRLREMAPLDFKLACNQRALELKAEKKLALKEASYHPSEEDSLFVRYQKKKALQWTIEALSNDWETLNKAQNAHSLGELQALNIEEKWRHTYALAMARVVSLRILNHGSHQELFDKVESSAVADMEAQISENRLLRDWLQKASPYERMKVRAEIYASSFVKYYTHYTTEHTETVSVSATEQEKKNADKRWSTAMRSPQQPGFFQSFRQTRFHKDGFIYRGLNKALGILNVPTRFVESFVDDQATELGLHNFLRRNLPFYHDITNGIKRSSFSFASDVTIKFGMFKYIFGISWPFEFFAYFVMVASVFIRAPGEWTTRMLRMVGVKPADTIRGKLLYAVPYSAATMPATIPFMAYVDDISLFFNTHVYPNLNSIAASISPEVMMAMLAASPFLLSPQFREFLKDTSMREKLEAARNAWAKLVEMVKARKNGGTTAPVRAANQPQIVSPSTESGTSVMGQIGSAIAGVPAALVTLKDQGVDKAKKLINWFGSREERKEQQIQSRVQSVMCEQLFAP